MKLDRQSRKPLPDRQSRKPAAGQTESSVTTDTSQEVTKEAGKNQVAVEKVQNTQEDGTAPQTEPIGEDEIFENITDISGMAGALKDGEYSVDADHFSAKLTSGGSSKVKIECQKVIVKNGKATAWINFSSSKYDKVWVKVNGTQNIYHAKPREGEAGVAFEIPVNLNSSMTFIGTYQFHEWKKYCIYDQYCNPGRYSPVDTIHTGSDRYYGIKFQRGI